MKSFDNDLPNVNELVSAATQAAEKTNNGIARELSRTQAQNRCLLLVLLGLTTINLAVTVLSVIGVL